MSTYFKSWTFFQITCVIFCVVKNNKIHKFTILSKIKIILNFLIYLQYKLVMKNIFTYQQQYQQQPKVECYCIV
jgi:hypothetical protein